MLMVGWPRSNLSNLGQERPPSLKRISWSTPLHSSMLPARSAEEKNWIRLIVTGSLFYLPKLCHIIGKGIIWIGSREKGLQVKVVARKSSLVENLDGEENCADLKSRAPLVLEDVQADPTQLVNVWVVDPGDEPHLHKVMLQNILKSSNYQKIINLTSGK